MPVPIDPRADGEAFSKQYDAEQAAQKAQEAPPEPVAPWKAAAQFVTSLPDRLDLPTLEQSVARVAAPWGEAAKRVGQDVAAGVSQLVKNTGDAAVNAAEALPPGVKPTPFVAEQQQQDHAIWTHAHNALQDFTDAVKVKDPNLVDVLTQYTAQVGPAYALYARSLGFLGARLANLAGGAVADATALPENAPRFADMLQMAQHTDGKIGQALQAAGPYGVNLYINYLAHPAAGAEQETALEAHLKNGLDGLMPNGLGNELLHAAMVTGRQGMRVLRTGIDNGVASVGDLGPLPGSPQAQRGAVGDLGKRPPLVQSDEDSAEKLLQEEVRKHMDFAAANPNAPRPQLQQMGVDPANPLYQAEVRRQADAAAKAAAKLVPPAEATPTRLSASQEAPLATSDKIVSKQSADQIKPLDASLSLENIAKSQAKVGVSDPVTAVSSKLAEVNATGEEHPLHDVISHLAEHLDSKTPDGADYKETFERLKEMNLGTKIVDTTTGKHAGAVNLRGQYDTTNDTIAFWPGGIHPDNVLHTVAHEATHAGTAKAIDENPTIAHALKSIAQELAGSDAAKSLGGQAGYIVRLARERHPNLAKELVAEANSNPQVRQAMKDTKAFMGGTLWDDYKGVVAHIFKPNNAKAAAALAATPFFDKLLTPRRDEENTSDRT